MPVSTLRGHARTFTATFVRDDDGRIVGMTGELSPEWTDDDLTAVLAVRADDAARCDGCGQLRSEAHDPATEGEWRADPVVCQACATASRIAAREDDKAGLMVRTSRLER